MRIKLGLGFAGMKGVLGGTIFQFVGSQQIARTRKNFNKLSSTRWSVQKANQASIAKIWRTLTVAQKATWDAQILNYPTVDKFGNPRTPSPYELFNRLNGQLRAITEPITLTAFAPQPITNLGAVAVGGIPNSSINVSWNNAITTNERIVIRISNHMNINSGFRRGRLKLIATATDADLNPFDLTSAYSALYGSLPASVRVWVEMYLVFTLTGQRGPSFRAFKDFV